VTTEGNELVRSIHERMPVIPHTAEFEAWLAPRTPQDQLQAQLRP
jgi:putative SOS response-associated peptidase YedK